MQPNRKDILLHLDELGVVDAVVTVQHPTDEMRDYVLLQNIVLPFIQKVSVERDLLVVGRQLREFVNARYTGLQAAHFFGRHGLQLLEKVDSPSRIADHLVPGRVLLQRMNVDQAVHFFLSNFYPIHLAQNLIFY